MTLLVPYDGSDLADAALERATEFGDAFDRDVVAVTVLPAARSYAVHNEWVRPGETYDPDDVASAFETRVGDVAPGATFRTRRLDEGGDSGRTVVMDIVAAIREVAAELDAGILFVGSDNAGRVASPITSVGDPLSDSARYDVHIVRHADD
jgi:nucleotide-binding universal stress UspA family protein